MILVFCMLSFKPTFLLSSFTFIKRLFSSSSLSAIRVKVGRRQNDPVRFSLLGTTKVKCKVKVKVVVCCYEMAAQVSWGSNGIHGNWATDTMSLSQNAHWCKDHLTEVVQLRENVSNEKRQELRKELGGLNFRQKTQTQMLEGWGRGVTMWGWLTRNVANWLVCCFLITRGKLSLSSSQLSHYRNVSQGFQISWFFKSRCKLNFNYEMSPNRETNSGSTLGDYEECVRTFSGAIRTVPGTQ